MKRKRGSDEPRKEHQRRKDVEGAMDRLDEKKWIKARKPFLRDDERNC